MGKLSISASNEISTLSTAKACDVAYSTVIYWINQGKLKVRETPGGHYKVSATSLLDFMRRHKMPVPKNFPGTGKDVLVVEDDPSVSQLVRRALRPISSLNIHCCDNGLQALIETGKRPPDLLVLDLFLPKIDGFEILRILRSDQATKEIKVIVITGEMLTSDQLKMIRSHADFFFEKPIAPIAPLGQKIVELLDLEPAEKET